MRYRLAEKVVDAEMSPNNKTVVIVGLGNTGLSIARALRRAGRDFRIVDSRAEPPGLAEFRLAFPEAMVDLGDFSAELLQAAEEIFLSPGVARTEAALQAALQAGVPVRSDIDYFRELCKAPLIAITGSNAKSTVTTLVGEFVRAAGFSARLGGNLGTPALDLLEDSAGLFGATSPAANEPTPRYVLELSSFQLENTDDLQADVATLLNLSPDHMDRYADLNAYLQAKQRIFSGAKTIVVNKDDPRSAAPSDFDGTLIRFGLGKPKGEEFGVLTLADGPWLAQGEQALLPVKQLKIPGKHNQSNALAALALGYAAGLPFSPMLRVLAEFKGLAHRCEWVREYAGVQFVNDSKGTNVGATQAAIEGLAEGFESALEKDLGHGKRAKEGTGKKDTGKIVLIAGGVGKGADFSPLREALKQHGRALVLIGEEQQALHQLFRDLLPSRCCDSLAEAIKHALAFAHSGDTLLFSPACASFDMFDNFMQRGEAFKSIVNAL